MAIPNIEDGKIGVVTEQGDLGLGFTQLNESDSAAYANAPKQEDNTSKEDNN